LLSLSQDEKGKRNQQKKTEKNRKKAITATNETSQRRKARPSPCFLPLALALPCAPFTIPATFPAAGQREKIRTTAAGKINQ
jgi:hypothetical protein